MSKKKKATKKKVVKKLKQVAKKIKARPTRRLPETAELFPPEPLAVAEGEWAYARKGKLSTTAIVGRRIPKIETRTKLYTIFGFVTEPRSGIASMGEWIGLAGQLGAIRVDPPTTEFPAGQVNKVRGDIWVAPPQAIYEEVCRALVSQEKGAVAVIHYEVFAQPSANEYGWEYDHTGTLEVTSLLGLIQQKIEGPADHHP